MPCRSMRQSFAPDFRRADKDIRTTERYLHPDQDDLAAAVAAIESRPTICYADRNVLGSQCHDDM